MVNDMGLLNSSAITTIVAKIGREKKGECNALIP
jgi:hypothetical protein